MKRIYVKPIMRVVSCRPTTFFASSSATHGFDEEEGSSGGPTGLDEGQQPNPGIDDARGFTFSWDE